MSSPAGTSNIESSLASISLQPINFQEIRDFLGPHTDLQVLRHFTTHPLPNAPPGLERAVGIAPDFEWHSQNPNNIIPQLEGKITQVGYTVFPMCALRECKKPADFPALLKKASIAHIRVQDNCHLRSKARIFVNTECNSLYAPTRFIEEEEVKTIFKDLLDNQLLEDGSKAPVIIIGHGWEHDELQIKNQWKMKLSKLDSVVYKVFSLAKLAAQAGIIPFPDRHLGQTYPKFDSLLAGFQIDMTGMWRHNGANDAVYQMTLAFAIVHFPMLYPNTPAGRFPTDSSIAGRNIKDLWLELATNKGSMPKLAEGVDEFCYRCDAIDDHCADKCPMQENIICELCSNALGKKNADYRKRARGHQAKRCTLFYNHHVRKFPQWLMDLNISLENLRKLSQGMAVKDLELIGFVFYTAILQGGPMGNDDIVTLEADEETRRAREEALYSDGEPTLVDDLEAEDVD
tara:strand:+ start:2928 stop:4304 length:1377 start_codon:yes stop_codon:yes gene_type:complete